MIFKLAEAAEKSWRRLDGHNQLPKIILGVKFTDGVEVSDRKLKPPPPDPLRHQHLTIARTLREPIFAGAGQGCTARYFTGLRPGRGADDDQERQSPCRALSVGSARRRAFSAEREVDGTFPASVPAAVYGP